MRNSDTRKSDHVSEALLIAIYISSIGLLTICISLIRSM